MSKQSDNTFRHQKSNVTDSKVHGANMGPIWGRQDPGGPMLAPWTLLSGMFISIVRCLFIAAFLKGACTTSIDECLDGIELYWKCDLLCEYCLHNNADTIEHRFSAHDGNKASAWRHKGPVKRKMFPFDDVTMQFQRAVRGWPTGPATLTMRQALRTTVEETTFSTTTTTTRERLVLISRLNHPVSVYRCG